MITVNECRVVDDALIVEAAVDVFDFLKDVEIGSVAIDTDETFVTGGPSEKPVYKVEFKTDYARRLATAPDGDTEGGKTGPRRKPERGRPCKHVRLRVRAKDMGLDTLSDNLFFVYLMATGAPAPSTPCGMDKRMAVAVAVDMRRVYSGAMAHIREIGRCEMPAAFIDFMLKAKVVELSVLTGNLGAAAEYWKRLFIDKTDVRSVSDCGCYGSDS